LSSRSRSTICCSFSVAFFSRSARPLALYANDCHSNMPWATYRHRAINGDDAGPEGMHVLVIFKPVFLPRVVIPINCALWQPWARRRRWRYLCARHPWTFWCQVDLRLVPDQVISPTRHSTDGVDVNNRRGDCRLDVPSGSFSSVSSARGSAHHCVVHGW
jgi:hypothetical protein